MHVIVLQLEITVFKLFDLDRLFVYLFNFKYQLRLDIRPMFPLLFKSLL